MSPQIPTSTLEGSVKASTLREAIEVKRVRGERFTLREAVAIIVPLTTHLAGLHAGGRKFFVHPSALHHGKAGTDLDLSAADAPPTHARDKASIAPECRRGEAGDARATVFSLGAILYELVTGEIVGPGMKRPSEAVPGLPAQLEVVLGKALVGDPKHRPSDLGALAQAFHHLAPSGSVAPPAADESRLDHDSSFDVDVSLSMIPPAPASNGKPLGAVKSGAYVVANAPSSNRGPDPLDPLQQLSALKTRLESDPRPRYVVIKDGMDHGPFTAVELLQQIASHQFVEENSLQDTLSGEERLISAWDDFALFAQQAKLNRDMKQERKALDAVVQVERKNAQWKLLVGVGLVSVLVAGGVGFWMRERALSKFDEKVQSDKASAIDAAAALSAEKGAAKAGGGTGTWSGGAGSFPQVGGGGSCEAAIARYTEDYSKQGVPPDLGAGAFSNLNNGAYLNSCGVPSNMTVNICAAVQNGRAVGVTVVTSPSNPGIAGCVKAQVSGMSFPSHPRLDVAHTTFAAN